MADRIVHIEVFPQEWRTTIDDGLKDAGHGCRAQHRGSQRGLWLISNEGQKAIADYKAGGEQVFWPQRE